MRQLYYGDNLQVLRDSIKAESVDLVYLDPPFNSAANYNILFKSPTGNGSTAQIEAFEDTWQWGNESEMLLEQMKFIHGELAQFLHFLVDALGRNAMSAYLVMMAARLVELHRVLKSTGSLYLHCDPTASHYLKVILDRIFGTRNFRTEVVWQRTSSHNDAKRWGDVHDVILFYSKTDRFTWNPVFMEHNEKYVKDFYRYQDGIGKYRLDHIIRSASMGARPNLVYEYKGFTPEWGWRVVREKLEALDQAGRLSWSNTGRPYLKRYLHEQKGTPIKSVITDIAPLSAKSAEKLGYPTQKPAALLERIIQASSNPGEVVLDPFCGCGTAVHAAEKLGRSWIGIDITHLAISLIENRLRSAFPGIEFEVFGTPTDLDGAKDLADRDKYQFQWWACSLVNAQPFGGKKKGADGGIDGQIFFNDFQNGKSALEKIIVSVKGGRNISLTMLKDLIATVSGNKAAMGFFVTLAPPTKPMLKEAAAVGFYRAGNGQQYPKIQILTIEGLLGGTERPQYFDLRMGDLTYKKAQRESIAQGQQQELTF